MAGKKKITAPPKKRATAASSSKTPKKKGGAKSAGKGKAPGAAKPAKRATKPTPKTAKKSTALKKKPAVKKVAPTKKTPAKAKVAAKTKTKEVSQTPKAAGALGDIKRALISKREAIVKEAKDEIAKYVSGENRQLVDTALDEGDWAVVDISEDINLRRLAAHRRALHDIDESLRKIREGSYGVCEECGEEIGEKRLHVLPTATLCVICQGNKELLEAIEKEAPSE